MKFDRRDLVKGACISAAASAFTVLPARKLSSQPRNVKIGVLTDLSGPLSDSFGAGSVACAKQAIQEFGSNRFTTEIVTADHQNKPDLATTIARRWFDTEGVDAIVDVPNSSVALAVNGVVRENNKVLLVSGAGASALTGQYRNQNIIHWTYNNAMLGASTGGALTREGNDSWYFITTDAAFGIDLERDATFFIRRSGGRVVGSTRIPPNANTDISAALAQAQTNRVRVVALATPVFTSIAAVRQAAETGFRQQQTKIAVMQMLISDVNALGLQVAQGAFLTATFYWDLNDRTRAFASRMQTSMRDKRPGMTQAGCYSAVLHYLKAVAEIGPDRARDGRETISRMKAMPTNDDAFGQGRIRDDGRKLHPAYLFQVKAPGESRAPWDYYRLVRTTPADEAFGFNPQSECPECNSGCRCQRSNSCECSNSCCN